MKKVLFIDRDGTLVIEPPVDYQLDQWDKLEFYPGAITYLNKIQEELDYELVMVTNQDGLGTSSFPEDTFWPIQNFIIQTFKGEGVSFEDVLIDKSFPEENKDTRKPGIGMMKYYMKGGYDLKNSVVIGDRMTDVELANNLGSKSIFIGEGSDDSANLVTKDWKEIYEFLKEQNRTSELLRSTKETNIKVVLNIDGTGKTEIETGLPFFNHMLEQIARHGMMDLSIQCKGDLEIDEHHTMEDVALALGEVFLNALGSKKGIDRYGFVLPMDDCLAQVAIDFGGRPWLVWDVEFNREKIGDVPTEMFMHFFKSFSDAAKCNLNIKAEGNNEHHKIEGVFKAFAKAIRMAVSRNSKGILPSTKGVL